MFRKILVANRGEIAVRAFRAATELGVTTVAVFPYEDRHAEYRLKADESYEIGERGHPVRAYLDVAGIVSAAQHAGADAIYPGYGFLSENPDLAQACEDAGITFIGPTSGVLELTGNKARAIAAAREAGLPTLRGSEPSDDVEALVAAAADVGFPVFVKAVSGGGGRGMRRVDEPRAAAGGAGRGHARGRIGLRRLPDVPGAGRDPSAAHRGAGAGRRHRRRDPPVRARLFGAAPAPEGRRDRARAQPRPRAARRICADAVRFARHIAYVNAGTVEFLLGEDGRYVFIEMNPRIQVEHTVTEEVTDIDLVSSQIRIAAGETLVGMGLNQDEVHVRGSALQCRITTEDPANGFRPDTGVISVYRTPGGAGVRLDGGVVFAGATVGAHFDSMLVKLTCRGQRSA